MSHLKISIDKHFGTESLSDIQYFLNELNIELEIEEHSAKGPYLSLDWIIPTGFSLIILKPYYETFLKKAAEDHYEMFKSFLKNKLYNKAINPENEFQIVTMNGVVKETIFTMHFSVMHTLNKDARHISLKLMFPKNCTAEYFEKSILEFSMLQAELEDKNRSDELFDKLLISDRGNYGVKILWFNEELNELEFLDLTQSAKTKSIVAKKFA